MNLETIIIEEDLKSPEKLFESDLKNIESISDEFCRSVLGIVDNQVLM